MKYFTIILNLLLISQSFAEDYRMGYGNDRGRTSNISYASCMTIVTEQARLAENCQGSNKPGYESIYAVCMEATFKNSIPYSDRGSMNSSRQYVEAVRNCQYMVTPPMPMPPPQPPRPAPTCEIITESYVFCNGNKYIRDVADLNALQRDAKKIENFQGDGKTPTDASSGATQK
jgi:hypothetical protein